MDADHRLNANEFKALLRQLDNRAYGIYRRLRQTRIVFDAYSLGFRHVQASPGAMPASVCELFLPASRFPVPGWAISNEARSIAAADYVLRSFACGVARSARQHRGADGSGSYQCPEMPQQILARNAVSFSPAGLSIAFRVSLPGTLSQKVLAGEAEAMFFGELADIAQAVKADLSDSRRFRGHCELVEDMRHVQDRLGRRGLVAFIADGSMLPRDSGLSDKPIRDDQGGTAFCAPEAAAVVLDFPNAGNIRGLGIREGVTVVVGGGFHGKSTLLHAVARGVYPHVAGDGRERVVTSQNAIVVSAEEGRSIQGLDISAFIGTLPAKADPRRFFTNNASGSTSQAAAIVEGMLAGADLLLIDEDASATNFLMRDRYMRQLIPDDPITPLFDRVRELYRDHGVSTMIVAGGSSDYLGVADHVIAMRDFVPVDMTARARGLDLPRSWAPAGPLDISDRRKLRPGNFDPLFLNRRMNKAVPVRIKALRGQECEILEYGMDLIDVRSLEGIVDPDQMLTLGHALLLARRLEPPAAGRSPSALARQVVRLVRREGLDVLQAPAAPPVFFAEIRLLELAGAINRLRSLAVDV
ncbi:ATPase [Desulfosarcina alkanivorans]|uniref:ATPase n=1 Tax=Desulfosarcina alkanivorans TaxID=571177 RepID=A0A5K7Z2S0_9BACT|nr:P-loop domain-containing protein [Desulfosarcina alkanivorans]BBO70947.1 ATPase [Desulfosarcina alkanivorans]